MRSPAGLNITVWGEGEPAVLVHGSFGWGEETWQAQRPLADSYRLLLVDRRGFGATPADGRPDFERDAGDIAALLDEPSHLVGHSYGGVVSLLAAARRPDAIRSLAVIEPPAIGLVRGSPVVEEFLAHMERSVDEAQDADEYRARFLEGFGFPAPKERLEGRALEAAVSSWQDRPPSEAEIPLEELARAAFPRLVVRGGWEKAPREARERGAKIFGAICDVLVRELSAESAVFPDAAHNPQLLGEPFNERLRAFWSSGH
jgi:pimeloyl-ACP methyl ester carboxylesterase